MARRETEPATPAPSASTAPARPWAPRTLLLLLALAPFLVTLGFGLVWDDRPLLVHNPELAQGPGAWVSTPLWHGVEGAAKLPTYRFLHRPLTKLVLFGGYRLSGGESGYAAPTLHLLACAAHGATIVALLALLAARRRSFVAGADEDDPRRVAFAMFAGALAFAWHPARVESVAWVSGIGDALMAAPLLYALALVHHAPGWRRDGALVVCVAAAGFAKEVALVAPLLVLLEGWARAPAPRELVRMTGLATLGALPPGLGLLGMRMQEGAVGRLVLGHPVERVLATIGAAAERTLAPFPATITPVPLPRASEGVLVVSPLLPLLGALVTATGVALFVRAARHGDRITAAGIGLLGVAFLPTSNLVPRAADTLVADRTLYLPGALLAAALATYGALQGTRATAARRARSGPLDATARVDDAGRDDAARTQRIAAVLALAALLGLTLVGLPRFASDAALARHEVAVHPTLPAAHVRLAHVELSRGRAQDAQRAAVAALRAEGDHPDEAVRTTALAAYGLARLGVLGTYDQPEVREVAGLLRALCDGGAYTLRHGPIRTAGSARHARAPAVADDPAICVVGVARAELAAGATPQAVERLARGLEARPDDAELRALLALAWARAGALDRARAVASAGGDAPTLRQARGALAEVERRRQLPPTARREAEIALVLGDLPAARRALAPTLMAGSPAPDDYLLLAEVERLDGSTSRARAMITRGLARFPDSAPLQRALAVIDADSP